MTCLDLETSRTFSQRPHQTFSSIFKDLESTKAMAAAMGPGNQSPTLFRLIVSMLVLSPVFVAPRSWSRQITVGNKNSMERKFWWDDWMALASLI